MYLKRLEISGFKSFANRTVIQFEKNVTAIVGPNGSGKSNTTEAIRWVLGEQSAKNLRGGKMPDIIFAGSDTRKPLNVAEVTMVLDNSDHYLPLDYAEVSVTRRLYRSGESEFYLNKQHCRLRDIQELFMDSGLGRESFSIISQGKVEAIFSSKAEDRRGIFEEAAGVLKYKQRKKQAEQKLFETEDNLNRLEDIIYELNEQLQPLAIQREKAQRYLTLKEQLTKVDVAFVVAEMKKAKENWENEKTQLADLQNALEQLSTQLQKTENQLLELRQKRTQLDETLEEFNQKHLHLVEALKQAEGKKAVLQERSKNTQKSAKEYQENLAQVENQIEQLENHQQQLINDLSQKNQTYQELEKQIAQTKENLQKYQRSTKEIIEELRYQYVEKLQEQTNINNDLKYIQKQKEQDLQKNEATLSQQDALSLQVVKANEQKQILTQQLVDKQTSLSAFQKEYSLIQSREHQLQEQLKKAQQLMYHLMNESQQIKAQRKTLQDLQENYTGYYQGVRQILRNKKQLGGILGAVAELIQVDSLYALAIETALGASAQHIIVKDEAAARKGITYLKQNRAGRATFLPLSTIQARQLPDYIYQQVQTLPGYVGVASQLVQYDEQITTIVENLLGTTLIAEDLASANQLARTLQYRYRVVSLEGDIMNAGGSMTGGANKKGSQANLFGHQGELSQLIKREKTTQTKLAQAESQVAQLTQALEAQRKNIEQQRQHLEQMRFEMQTLQHNVDNQQELLQRLQQEQTNFEVENASLTTLLADYDVQLQTKAQQLQELTAELAQLQDEMEHLNTQADVIEEKRMHYQELLAKQNEQFAVAKEQIAHLKDRFTANKLALEEASQRQAMLEQQLASLDADFTDHELDEESLQTQVNQLNERKLAMQEQMQTTRQQRYQVQTTISQLDEQAVQLNQEQKQKMSAIIRIEVEVNRSEILLDNRLTYLQEEYKLTFEAACTQAIDLADLDQAKIEIHHLKKEIEQLGSINLNAIEQYSQVNERHSFLISQRDDLLQAKAQLFETMNEMDQEVQTRFKEVFDAIALQFEWVFPNMFGGGRARLYLTDPTDLLHTGIEIEAQPPGKRLKNLNLLSGGERTLTAIALLFSIIQVRPVPFCVLDEVEAALDEANVIRFGKYLQSYQEDTQFIVVTHRKGTMEAADVLYGVTMEESGVSKMISVHLEEITEGGNINRQTSTE